MKGVRRSNMWSKQEPNSGTKQRNKVENLGDLFSQIEKSGHSLFIRGYFNVEGGQASISNGLSTNCDCIQGFLGVAIEVCPDCGAGDKDYVSIPSGMGDGIYVVTEVRAEGSSKAVGAVVVFDSQYLVANAVREQVEDEQVPHYPAHLISEQPVDKAFSIAQLRPKPKLFFSDAIGFGVENAGVSVELEDSLVDVIALTSPIAPNFESWAENYTEITGLSLGPAEGAEIRALREHMGYNSVAPEDAGLPTLYFRAVLVLTSALRDALQLEILTESLDWQETEARQGISIVTSHITPMGTSAMFENYLLSREWDRAAGEGISDEEALDLLFECWSWLFQAALAGETDYLRIVRENTYKPSQAEIAAMLASRGCLATTDQIEGLVEKPGLTKFSPSSSLTKAKYCPNCGVQTNNGLNRFCPNCGKQLGTQ
jgi:hypothetical protein